MADVGMIERRDGSRLALEALFQIRIGREMSWQDFDGDVAAETHVPCAIHFSHPTRTERCEDLVGAKSGARGQGHRLVVDYIAKLTSKAHRRDRASRRSR